MESGRHLGHVAPDEASTLSIIEGNAVLGSVSLSRRPSSDHATARLAGLQMAPLACTCNSLQRLSGKTTGKRLHDAQSIYRGSSQKRRVPATKSGHYRS